MININNMQWGFNGQPPPQDLFQECKDCPYIGQQVQMKDAVQICEIGINKQKQGEEE